MSAPPPGIYNLLQQLESGLRVPPPLAAEGHRAGEAVLQFVAWLCLSRVEHACRERMLEEATAAMWEVVTQEQFGITQQVETAVHQALCRTSEQGQGQGQGQAAGGATQAALQPGVPTVPRFGA